MGQTRSQDDKRTYHQQAPGVQVFEHASHRCLDEAKERRRSLNPSHTRVTQSSHAREHDLGVQSTLFVFRGNGLSTKCQFCFLSPQRFESRRSHSVSSSQTTSLCSGRDHLHHHEHAICAVGDHLPSCNPRFVMCVGGWPRASWFKARTSEKNS